MGIFKRMNLDALIWIQRKISSLEMEVISMHVYSRRLLPDLRDHPRAQCCVDRLTAISVASDD